MSFWCTHVEKKDSPFGGGEKISAYSTASMVNPESARWKRIAAGELLKQRHGFPITR
jgi:hypothetical protein